MGELSPLELELRVALKGRSVGEEGIRSGGALNLRSALESHWLAFGGKSEAHNAPKPIFESEIWRFGNPGGIPFTGEVGVLDRLAGLRLGNSGGTSASWLPQGEDSWDLLPEGRVRDGKGGGWFSVCHEGANGESSNGKVG